MQLPHQLKLKLRPYNALRRPSNALQALMRPYKALQALMGGYGLIGGYEALEGLLRPL